MIEIVTAIYKDRDKLESWRHNVGGHNLTVYNKVDDLSVVPDNYPDYFHSGEQWEYNIGNYGRCDYAFLWHIINRWDDLADTTVFTKVNWQDTHNRLHDVISAASDYDFVENGVPRCLQSLVNPTTDNNGLEVQYKDRNVHAYGAEGIKEWSDYIFQNDQPWKWVASVHGPCFSVSKELIKQHDISTYRYLLSRFYPESKSWNQKLAREKYGLDTIEKQISDSGRHFHDELLRFWHILFCHKREASIGRKGLYIHV